MPQQRPMLGITFKIISVSLFITMFALVKAAMVEVPAGQAVFFRSLFAIPVIFVWLWMRHDMKTGLITKDPLNHFWRGLIGTTAMALGFSAVSLLPLPEVTAIGYAAPVFVVIFAAMFLGEPVRIFRLSAVGLGMVGVLIILSPRLTVVSLENADKLQTLGACLAIMGAVFMALAQVFIRKLVRTEQTPAIVFYFSLTATGLSLLTLPFGWVMPSTPVVLMLILAGLIGGVGQIFLTTGYRYADAGTIAPFEYVSMLFALIIGYWVFDEVPSITVLIGVAVVIFAGLLIIWRESRLGLERRQPRKVMTPQG